MKRYDLRELKANFYDRMMELTENDLNINEVGIYLFEVGDFSAIQKSADMVHKSGHKLMNSLKFNEVDWTIVVKRLSDDEALKNREKYAEALVKKAQAAAEKPDASSKDRVEA